MKNSRGWRAYLCTTAMFTALMIVYSLMFAPPEVYWGLLLVGIFGWAPNAFYYLME